MDLLNSSRLGCNRNFFSIIKNSPLSYRIFIKSEQTRLLFEWNWKQEAPQPVSSTWDEEADIQEEGGLGRKGKVTATLSVQ